MSLVYLRFVWGEFQDEIFDEPNEDFIVELNDVSPGAYRHACRVQEFVQRCHVGLVRLLLQWRGCGSGGGGGGGGGGRRGLGLLWVCEDGACVGGRGMPRPVVEEDTAK